MKNQSSEIYSLLNKNCSIDDSAKNLIKEICLNNPDGKPIFKYITSESKSGSSNFELFTNQKDIELIVPTYTDNIEINLIAVFGAKKSSFPINDDDLELINNLIYITNTELKRLELQKMLMFQQEEITKLEEINQMKSFFVSSVSHELKTPLTAIKLFTEILSSSNNLRLEQKQEFFNIINGECD